MPKLVDHDEYRQQLAQGAAALFSTHGYNGLGMRAIADALGISKSALYHYFPTKKALFHACTDLVTRFSDDLPAPSLLKLPLAERVHMLIEETQAMEATFPAEMSLLIDYLRGWSMDDVAADPTMQLAADRYRDLVRTFVAETDVEPVLCLMLGTLLARFLDGGRTGFETVEQWLIARLT